MIYDHTHLCHLCAHLGQMEELIYFKANYGSSMYGSCNFSIILSF